MQKNLMKKSLVCGIILLFLSTTVVSSSSIHVPEPLSTISISGTIYGLPLDGTGPVPVENAKVSLFGGKLIGGITFAFEKSLPTNSEGYYSFSDIPVGIFFVFARKPGEFLPGFRLVRLTSSQPTKQNQDINMIRLGGGNNSQVHVAVIPSSGSFNGSMGPRLHSNLTVGTIWGTYQMRNRGGRFTGEWNVFYQNVSKTGTMRGMFLRFFVIGRITIDEMNRTLPIIGFIRFTNGSFVGRCMAPRGPALYFWGTSS
ncbi:MAG: carboxypeptidase regulatory-like domain-containing protein [Candidatus Thermoplasmatota archaeon]|nr:carboxypeptidase regulatory-like domain-containing protein [Candidatus Thermoplasmatota archaeon]